MNSLERARRVQALFEAVIVLEAREREAFLSEACTDDPALRRAVEALLAAYARADTDGIFPPLQLSTPGPSLVGERLGPYTILREIAEGGMGAVYLAEREDVGLRVALKLVRYGRLAAPQHVQRFLLERRALARLQHPNVARLLDAGVTHEGLPYLVMEYVEGEPIDRFCDARRLGIEERLRLFLQVCGAVEYAHRKAVIHRDLKPGNILVTAEGEAKLLDFGIAKLLAESEAETRLLTHTGTLLATPEYASPEQIRCEPVTPASDVYSLGLVLYELLTGHHPYRVRGCTPQQLERVVRATDPQPLARAVLATEEIRRSDGAVERITPERVSQARGTDPERLRKRLSGELEAIVGKALAKEPERRYTSIEELCGDITRHLDGLPILARPEGRAQRARRWAGRQLRRPVRAAVLAVLVLLALGLSIIPRMGLWRGSAESPPAISSNAVAVLPFAVRGSAEYGYLADGIADLLSRALDGAGELRSVDIQAILSVTDAEVGRALGPEQVERLAGRLGAGVYVLGSAAVVNDRVRIAASLHDARREGQELARAEVEGDASELFRLVDELAKKLLAERFRRPGERLFHTAALTTSSLPAFKAYLEGERHHRAARAHEAVEAFQRAVAEDTAFALAHYRMSFAASSTSFTQLMHEAAEAAMRHAGRLSERDRLLLAAWAARLVGQTDRAEEFYRRVLHFFPSDTEATFHLADLQFHHNPYRGRSTREARWGLTRSLEVPQVSRDAADHLLWILALERDRAAFDSLVTRLRTADRLVVLESLSRLLYAATWSDAADQNRAAAELQTRSDLSVMVRVWRVGTSSRNLVFTERLARLVTDPARAPEVRAWGYLSLADLALARGRWSAAKAELAHAVKLAPLRALEVHGLYATLPFLPVPREEIGAVRDTLARWSEAGAAGASSPPFIEFYPGARPAIRLYVLGRLAVRLGDHAASEGYARALDAIGSAEVASKYSRFLAQGLRADLAWERGNPQAALAALEAAPRDLPRDYAPVHFATEGSERFLRGRVLQQLGRYEEALGWYGSLEELAIADLVYLGPSLLHQAEIHERLGNREQAIQHYARFIELWQACDPELRPLREEAERRLAQLRRP